MNGGDEPAADSDTNYIIGLYYTSMSIIGVSISL